MAILRDTAHVHCPARQPHANSTGQQAAGGPVPAFKGTQCLGSGELVYLVIHLTHSDFKNTKNTQQQNTGNQA